MISSDPSGSGGQDLEGRKLGKRKRQSPSKNPSSPEYKQPHRAASSVPDAAQGLQDDAAAQAKVARKLMFQASGDAAARPAQSKRSKVIVSQKEAPAPERRQGDEAGTSDRSSKGGGGKKRKRRSESSDGAHGAGGAAEEADAGGRGVRDSAGAGPEAGQKESSLKDGAGKKKKKQRVKAVQGEQDGGGKEPGEGGGASSSGQPVPEPSRKQKKRKKRRMEEVSGVKQNAGGAVSGAQPVEEPTPGGSGATPGILKLAKGKSRKKVTFEEPVEPAPAAPQDAQVEANVEAEDEEIPLRPQGWVRDNEREDLISGRFSKEEDQLLKQAVFDYFRSHGWSEEDGLNKLLSGVSSKECSGCWFEIGNCLPRRSIKALYSRAHRLLDPGNHRGKWSAEEEESLIRLHAEHGSNWAKISKLMGRYTYNIKDKWRDLKLRATHKTGPIQQSELEQVAALVHKFVRTKSLLGKQDTKKDRREIRDGINWDAIAESLGTRSHSIWCKAWYVTLASSMIAEGLWANGDDQRLLQRLLESGASADEAVDWDNLLDNREGHICQRRWEQMAKHLGPHRLDPFEERLQRLVMRYAPYLLEEGDRQPDLDVESE